MEYSLQQAGANNTQLPTSPCYCQFRTATPLCEGPAQDTVEPSKSVTSAGGGGNRRQYQSIRPNLPAKTQDQPEATRHRKQERTGTDPPSPVRMRAHQAAKNPAGKWDWEAAPVTICSSPPIHPMFTELQTLLRCWAYSKGQGSALVAKRNRKSEQSGTHQ